MPALPYVGRQRQRQLTVAGANVSHGHTGTECKDLTELLHFASARLKAEAAPRVAGGAECRDQHDDPGRDFSIPHEQPSKCRVLMISRLSHRRSSAVVAAPATVSGVLVPAWTSVAREVDATATESYGHGWEGIAQVLMTLANILGGACA